MRGTSRRLAVLYGEDLDCTRIYTIAYRFRVRDPERSAYALAIAVATISKSVFASFRTAHTLLQRRCMATSIL